MFPWTVFTSILPGEDLAGLSIVTKGEFAISWKDADGDIMKEGFDGVTRSTAGFTTALIQGDDANEEYKGDKVQGNANGGEVMFSMNANKSVSAGGLLLRAWRGPTEGTSTGATKIAEWTGPAASSGAGSTTNEFFAVLGANEYLMLEWVSAAAGAPSATLTNVALVTRG